MILYIKPAYHGDENIGIRSYAATNPEFPHQGTGDQFFSESQFESYRALGFEIADEVLKDAFGANPPKEWTVCEMTKSLRAAKPGEDAKKTASDA